MAFDSSSVRLVVVGKGPLGAFTARVSAVELKGEYEQCSSCIDVCACEVKALLALVAGCCTVQQVSV